MDFDDVVFGIESACPATLVGDDSDWDASLIETAYGLNGARDKLNTADVADVVIVDYDRTVSVEKYTWPHHGLCFPFSRMIQMRVRMTSVRAMTTMTMSISRSTSLCATGNAYRLRADRSSIQDIEDCCAYDSADEENVDGHKHTCACQ